MLDPGVPEKSVALETPGHAADPNFNASKHVAKLTAKSVSSPPLAAL